MACTVSFLDCLLYIDKTAIEICNKINKITLITLPIYCDYFINYKQQSNIVSYEIS